MPLLTDDRVRLSTTSLLPAFDDDLSRRFEAFAAQFRSVFQRADQALRFRAYLRGLLEPIPRKNVESLAAAASRVLMVEADLAQALQHFITQSPWNHLRLLAAVRKHAATLRADPQAVWVVRDAAFPKKGQHSVGVQRQFARALGRKLNCQIGVFVAQVGPRGAFPLAMRLYLPATWLKENEELAARTIPAEYRGGASKAATAVELLAELEAAGEIVPAIRAEAGYLNAPEFTDAVAAKGWTLAGGLGEGSADTAALDWMRAELGLDHFEGRAWSGWHHHVAVVFAAYHFLAADGTGRSRPPFPALR